MAKDFQYDEAVIDQMIRYLKTIDPEHATPEWAIRMLETEYAKNHRMSHEDPEVLDLIYKDFKENKGLS